MSEKARIMQECSRANAVRRVYEGHADRYGFFRNVRGSVLISGCRAVENGFPEELICEYASRKDMLSIVLTSRQPFIQNLQELQKNGSTDGIVVTGPMDRNYHPMYGLSGSQILNVIKTAAEEMGCKNMDLLLIYTAALLNITASEYPLSLPAISALLKEDDDTIAEIAVENSLTENLAEHILGNCESGIILRRIVEKLEEMFRDTAQKDSETKYSFQSGTERGIPVMVFFQMAGDQKIMNQYLKEEIYAAAQRSERLRIVLHETIFTGEDDPLMNMVFQLKRQGTEVVVISRNALEMLCGGAMDFENVCLSGHGNPEETERISEKIFGFYQHHEPTTTVGKPPSVFFTLRKDIRWQDSSEKRLKIRAEDLYGARGFFGNPVEKAAIRTVNNSGIYLVPVTELGL